MKKIITLSLCVLAFTFANSQESSTSISDGYKQSSGDKNLELQFDPGAIFNATNSNNMFSNGVGIRYRQFASESFAYRLNLNISYTNSKTVTQDADDNQSLDELKDKYSSIGISLQPGIEKHFTGTKRLSPYLGAEVILGFQTGTLKSEYQAGTDVYETRAKNASFADGLTLGIAGVAGADFYIAEKLYLGLELNYGLNAFTAFKTKYSDTGPGTADSESKVGKSNTLSFRPVAMGVLRIGFLF